MIRKHSRIMYCRKGLVCDYIDCFLITKCIMRYYAYVFECVYVCVYLCVYPYAVHVCICVRVHACMCMRAYTFGCMLICMRISLFSMYSTIPFRILDNILPSPLCKIHISHSRYFLFFLNLILLLCCFYLQLCTHLRYVTFNTNLSLCSQRNFNSVIGTECFYMYL